MEKYLSQGMGSIRGERKFENPFEFPESHKLWIDANHKPVVRGTDSSIWDRLITIPFDVVIPEEDKDPELLAKLIEEAEGLLAWAVAGARRWYAEGRRLPRPAEVRAAGEVYRAEMDIVGRFLEEHCEMAPALKVGSTELYKAYRRSAERAGERPMTQNSFTRRLKNRKGIAIEHKESGTVFFGVALRSVSADVDCEEE